MQSGIRGRSAGLSLGFVLWMAVSTTSAQHASTAAGGTADGQHDFDWEIGAWKTHVRRLAKPLSGAAAEWVEYDGTTIVREPLRPPSGDPPSLSLVANFPKGVAATLTMPVGGPAEPAHA